MKQCEPYQQAMDEVLAFGGGPEEFSGDCRAHLEQCDACKEFLDDSLALNLALEEPLPFPPSDLTERVMAKIAEQEPVEAKLPWAERFAWLACGAIAMFSLERLPEYSGEWLSSLQAVWTQTEWMLRTPVTASGSTLVLAAFLLAAVQGGLIYRARSTS